MKTMKFKAPWGDTYELALLKDTYMINGALYLGLIDVNTLEEFCDLTVNLPTGIADNTVQYVDANTEGMEKLVKKYKLGKPLGMNTRSGFVDYPLYQFNENEINKYLVDECWLKENGLL